MVRRMKWILVLTAMAAMAVGVTAAPSYATPANRTTLQGTSAVALTGGPEADLAGCNGVPVEAYGYVGCAKSDTSAQGCPWEEWFVIAPDRTIWHAWPNSGGWKQMPNNGRADDTWNCYTNGNGQHQVEVSVWGKGKWYSYLSGGSWRGWYQV